MKNKILISAIITSGGSSSRFGANKLLEKITDLSVIETTVLKFIDLVDEIIIPCKDDIKDHILNSKIYNNKIKFTSFGKTRQKSVYEGIKACSNPKIVLIHDGARPFIAKDTIQKAIDLTFKKKAVVVGYSAIDTIKEIENGKIIKTLNRKNIFHAQTPQSFEFDLIKKIHQIYQNEDTFTDDASMAEKFGVDVYILEGSKSNIKITTKDDLNFIPQNV